MAALRKHKQNPETTNTNLLNNGKKKKAIGRKI